MEKNNCYNCPHRGEVSGSAHSRCNHPAFTGKNGLAVAMHFAERPGTKMVAETTDGEEIVLLEFDPHGVRNGWCLFPINFDPVWVTCRLPVEEKETA